MLFLRHCTILATALIALASCAQQEQKHIPGPPPAVSSAPAVERPLFTQEGNASWYGKFHDGKATASGEAFDMDSLSAAHRTLAFGTVVRVSNPANGKSVQVRINDRGPFAKNRVIDLSARAARELGIAQNGVARVRIEQLPADQAERQTADR